MKKINKLLYLILILSILTSCSTRKVQVESSVVKLDSIVKKEDVVIVKEVDGVYVKKDIDIDQITITPIDSQSQIVVDGKIYKNVVLTIKKLKDNSLHTKSKTTQIAASKTQIKEVKGIKEVKRKDIVKKTSPLSYSWLYMLIAIIVFIIYKYLKNTNILKAFN